MTADLVDFLPQDYREGAARRRGRKYRLMLLVLVAGALLATEVLFRQRVVGVKSMARLASEHAESRSLRLTEVRDLVSKKRRLSVEIAEITAPMNQIRMADVLDGLLVGRTDDVSFRELVCSMGAGGDGAMPLVNIDGVCRDPEQIAAYLKALNGSDVLPTLRREPSTSRSTESEPAFCFATAAPVGGGRE